MKRMTLQTARPEHSRALTYALCALGVLLLSYLGFSLPSYKDALRNAPQWRPSALQLSLEPLFFGGASFMPIICVSVAYAPMQIDELRGGFALPALTRESWARYTTRHFAAAALQGAVVAGDAFALHSLIMNIIAAPYDVARFAAHELPWSENSITYPFLNIAKAAPVYLLMSMGHSLFGAAWAMIALSACVWIKDKIMTAAFVLCCHQFWTVFPYRLFNLKRVPPSVLLYEDTTAEMLTAALIVYLVLLAGAVLLYVVGLKREMRHA